MCDCEPDRSYKPNEYTRLLSKEQYRRIAAGENDADWLTYSLGQAAAMPRAGEMGVDWTSMQNAYTKPHDPYA